MVPTSTTWRMADRLVGGRLAEKLIRLQNEGSSTREIATALWNENGVEVSHVTIGTWLGLLNRSEPVGEAS